jgi:hypothetical protein
MQSGLLVRLSGMKLTCEGGHASLHSVTLYDEPATQEVGKMHAEDFATVLDRRGSSLKILTCNGVVGWIDSKWIEVA